MQHRCNRRHWSFRPMASASCAPMYKCTNFAPAAPLTEPVLLVPGRARSVYRNMDQRVSRARLQGAGGTCTVLTCVRLAFSVQRLGFTVGGWDTSIDPLVASLAQDHCAQDHCAIFSAGETMAPLFPADKTLVLCRASQHARPSRRRAWPC